MKPAQGTTKPALQRFETHKGCSGHLTVWRGDRRTVMPMHGSRKELGAGLVNKILKDLEIKR